MKGLFPRRTLRLCTQFHSARGENEGGITIPFQKNMSRIYWPYSKRQSFALHRHSPRRPCDFSKVTQHAKLCDRNMFLTREGLCHLRKRKQLALGQTKVGGRKRLMKLRARDSYREAAGLCLKAFPPFLVPSLSIPGEALH